MTAYCLQILMVKSKHMIIYLPEELEGSCSLGGDEGGCPPALPLSVGGVLDVVGVTGVLVGGTDQC